MVVGSLTFFDLIFVLTAGGPGDATRVLALDMYTTRVPGQPDGAGQRHRRASWCSSVWGWRCCCAGSAAALPPTASWKEPDMSATLTSPPNRTASIPARRPMVRRRARMRGGERPNWLGALIACLWLAVVMIPIYWIVITSFKSQTQLLRHQSVAAAGSAELGPATSSSSSRTSRATSSTASSSRWARSCRRCCISFMAAYAIVRGKGRFLRWANMLFLSGLAIPLQAMVIPVYLIIIRLRLYDTPLAIILPSIAFAIPLSVLMLANFIRDVPKELFESMRMDGASEWATMWQLAFPADPASSGHGVGVQRADGVERIPAAVDLDPEPGPADSAAGAVDVSRPVQRQRARRHGVRRPHHASRSSCSMPWAGASWSAV